MSSLSLPRFIDPRGSATDAQGPASFLPNTRIKPLATLGEFLKQTIAEHKAAAVPTPHVFASLFAPMDAVLARPEKNTAQRLAELIFEANVLLEEQPTQTHFTIDKETLRYLRTSRPFGVDDADIKHQWALLRDDTQPEDVRRAAATVCEYGLLYQLHKERQQSLDALHRLPDMLDLLQLRMQYAELPDSPQKWQAMFQPIEQVLTADQAFQSKVAPLYCLSDLRMRREQLVAFKAAVEDYAPDGHGKNDAEKLAFVFQDLGWIFPLLSPFKMAQVVSKKFGAEKDPLRIGALISEIDAASADLEIGDMDRYHALLPRLDDSPQAHRIARLGAEARLPIQYRDTNRSVLSMAAGMAVSAGVGAELGVLLSRFRILKAAADGTSVANLGTRMVVGAGREFVKQTAFVNTNAAATEMLGGHQHLYDFSKGGAHNLKALAVEVAMFSAMGKAHGLYREMTPLLDVQKFIAKTQRTVWDFGFFHLWQPADGLIAGALHNDAARMQSGLDGLYSLEGFLQTIHRTIALGAPLGDHLAQRAVKFVMDRHAPEAATQAHRDGLTERERRLMAPTAFSGERPSAKKNPRHPFLRYLDATAPEISLTIDRLTAPARKGIWLTAGPADERLPQPPPPSEPPSDRSSDPSAETGKAETPPPRPILQRDAVLALASKAMTPDVALTLLLNAPHTLGEIIRDWEAPGRPLSDSQRVGLKILSNPDIPSVIRAMFYELVAVHTQNSSELNTALETILNTPPRSPEEWTQSVESLYRLHTPHGEAVLAARDLELKRGVAGLEAPALPSLDATVNRLSSSKTLSPEQSLTLLVHAEKAVEKLETKLRDNRRHFNSLAAVWQLKHLPAAFKVMFFEVAQESPWALPVSAELLKPERLEELEATLSRWYTGHQPESPTVFQEWQKRAGETNATRALRYVEARITTGDLKKAWATLFYKFQNRPQDVRILKNVMVRAYEYALGRQDRNTNPLTSQSIKETLLPQALTRFTDIHWDSLRAYVPESDPIGKRAATLLTDMGFLAEPSSTRKWKFLLPHELENLEHRWRTIFSFISNAQDFLRNTSKSRRIDPLVLRVAQLTRQQLDEALTQVHRAATGDIVGIDPWMARRLIHHCMSEHYTLLTLVLWGLESNYPQLQRQFSTAASLIRHYDAQRATLRGNILSPATDPIAQRKEDFERVVLLELARPNFRVAIQNPDIRTFSISRPDLVLTHPNKSREAVEIGHFYVPDNDGGDNSGITNIITKRISKASRRLAGAPQPTHRLILGVYLSDPRALPSHIESHLAKLPVPPEIDTIDLWLVDRLTQHVTQKIDLAELRAKAAATGNGTHRHAITPVPASDWRDELNASIAGDRFVGELGKVGMTLSDFLDPGMTRSRLADRLRPFMVTPYSEGWHVAKDTLYQFDQRYAAGRIAPSSATARWTQALLTTESHRRAMLAHCEGLVREGSPEQLGEVVRFRREVLRDPPMPVADIMEATLRHMDADSDWKPNPHSNIVRNYFSPADVVTVVRHLATENTPNRQRLIEETLNQTQPMDHPEFRTLAEDMLRGRVAAPEAVRQNLFRKLVQWRLRNAPEQLPETVGLYLDNPNAGVRGNLLGTLQQAAANGIPLNGQAWNPIWDRLRARTIAGLVHSVSEEARNTSWNPGVAVETDPELALAGVATLLQANQLSTSYAPQVMAVVRVMMERGPSVVAKRGIDVYGALLRHGAGTDREIRLGLTALRVMVTKPGGQDLAIRAATAVEPLAGGHLHNEAVRALEWICEHLKDPGDVAHIVTAMKGRIKPLLPTDSLPAPSGSILIGDVAAALFDAYLAASHGVSETKAVPPPRINVPQHFPSATTGVPDIPPSRSFAEGDGASWARFGFTTSGEVAAGGPGVPRDAFGVSTARALPGGSGGLKVDARMSDGNGTPIREVTVQVPKRVIKTTGGLESVLDRVIRHLSVDVDPTGVIVKFLSGDTVSLAELARQFITRSAALVTDWPGVHAWFARPVSRCAAAAPGGNGTAAPMPEPPPEPVPLPPLPQESSAPPQHFRVNMPRVNLTHPGPVLTQVLSNVFTQAARKNLPITPETIQTSTVAPTKKSKGKTALKDLLKLYWRDLRHKLIAEGVVSHHVATRTIDDNALNMIHYALLGPGADGVRIESRGPDSAKPVALSFGPNEALPDIFTLEGAFTVAAKMTGVADVFFHPRTGQIIHYRSFMQGLNGLIATAKSNVGSREARAVATIEMSREMVAHPDEAAQQFPSENTLRSLSTYLQRHGGLIPAWEVPEVAPLLAPPVVRRRLPSTAPAASATPNVSP